MILRVVAISLLVFFVCGCSFKNNPIGSYLRIKQTTLEIEEFQVDNNLFVLRFEVPNSFIYTESNAVFDFSGERKCRTQNTSLFIFSDYTWSRVVL